MAIETLTQPVVFLVSYDVSVCSLGGGIKNFSDVLGAVNIKVKDSAQVGAVVVRIVDEQPEFIGFTSIFYNNIRARDITPPAQPADPIGTVALSLRVAIAPLICK